ncbi:MAG: isochorismate synthase [Saprospiraceae bacterium]|nr:isochorismate synthase [Saprospiraceae bacterium]
MIKLRQHDIFALYNLPYSTEHFLIRQMDNQINEFNDKSLTKQGFVIHPFVENRYYPAVFIRKDEWYRNPTIAFYSNHKGSVKSIDRTTYLKEVQQFIRATQRQYKKVIFSRIETIKLQTGDLFQLFITLKEMYKNAFVYLFNLPGIGCWMGASPEVFVTQNGDNYETVALAGTQRNLGIPLENVFWGEKEIEEQAIVERYVEEKLQQQKVSYQKTVPYTSQAGKLLHLKTKFRFRPTSDAFNFLKVLHPTPAVCGIPKQAATDFILHHEQHERGYYSGFLGPLNIDKKSNLFVNLRCMQVFKDKFALYVGGGITADSNAEKEWDETEIKSQTMADVIERIYMDSVMV